MQSTWQKYRSLILATRAKDWRFSFIPQIFGNLYLWLILFNIPLSASSLLLLVMSLITSFGFAALGYFINEFFDKEDDTKAGKINKLMLLSGPKQLVIFCAILAFTFAPWLILPFNSNSITLIGVQVGLFLVYAMPPLRFKKVPYLSVITDALYAYTVPFILSYYTYFLYAGANTINILFVISYGTLLFVAGFRNIIIHYINYIFKDKKSEITTLPRMLGVKATNNLLKFLLCAEALVSFFVIYLVGLQEAWLWLLCIAVLYLLYKAYRQAQALHDDIIVNRPIRHVPDLYYQVYAPAIILLVLVIKNPIWLLIAPIHIALFVPLFRLHPIISWFQRINFRLYYIWIRKLTSCVVNYTIFFLFLLIGVNLKNRQTSAWGYLKKKLHLN